MQQKVSRPTMIHYIRVWLMILKLSIKKSYSYKLEVFLRLLRTVFLIAIQIILLNAVFGEKEIFLGWTKDQAYLVMGIWNFVNYFGWSLFGVNLLYLDSKILSGEFDFVLLKPISTVWLSSFGDFFIYNMVSSVSGLILIGYFLIKNWEGLVVNDILFGVCGIAISFILWYAIYLLFASFTISKPKNGLMSVAKEILGLTKYPVDIFGSKLQFILYSVIPLGFISTLPANLIVGRSTYYLLPIALVISLFLMTLSVKLWRWNIKRYISSGG